MSTERIHFIDWMKAIGITLIVFGHVAGNPINHLTPPVYPKQLGVAFFVFVMGFGLARETRSASTVMFNRLFDMYVVTAAVAVIITALSWWTSGNLVESNYLPLLAGINVVFPTFPGNPTTWFVGTYLHLLLFWLMTRDLRVTPRVLGTALVAEVLLRAAVIPWGGYVAYMLLPNWLTLFLLGRFAAERWPVEPSIRWPMWGALVAALVVVTWMYRSIAVEVGTPFMQLGGPSPLAALWTSLGVSTIYLGWTAICFLTFCTVTAPPVVRFLARNTVVLFIVHMPLYYLLAAPVASRWPAYAPRAAVLLIACLIAPAILSDLILGPLHQLRARIAEPFRSLAPSS